uniref:Transposon Ty1-NL2 Gag-Pol polyprotein n=1 Tax=Talaromyces marneffei PM1 TaxID=1077442 RepID=A0A093UYI9_TALMA
MNNHPEKPVLECLEIMFADMEKMYHKLRPELRTEALYIAKLFAATRLVPACHGVSITSTTTVYALMESLRRTVTQWEDTKKEAVSQGSHVVDAYYTNRRYHHKQSSSPHRGRSPHRNRQQYDDRSRRRATGSYSAFLDRAKAYFAAGEEQPPIATNQDDRADDKEFKAFLAGVDAPSSYETEDREDQGPLEAAGWFTTASPEHEKFSHSLAQDLANRSTAHFLESMLRTEPHSKLFEDIATTTDALYNALPVLPQYSFLTEPRYSTNTFNVVLDTSTAGQASIRFGPGESIKSIGSIDNVLVGPSPGMTTPVSRRFGHPFLIWDHALQSYLTESFDAETCFLTETELRRLHRRFGHPSVEKLRRMLERAGHNVDSEALKHIWKVCHHFKSMDDVSFNHSIIVDIMYINGKPVLHVVDEATRFNAAHWLDNISAKATWTTLRIMWIDMYLGPPDFIVTDAGKNFTSKEFSQNALSMNITVTTVPVEAHWSIGTVERYHAVLRRSYEIMKKELPGPDGLVPTLLVFGAYPRMTEYDPPSPTTTQRAAAVKKAMTEIRKIRAQRQISDALNTRNGPSSTAVHRLPLNSDVLVWREGNTGYAGEWTGSYKLLAVNNETCIIELPSGPTSFRSTAVKPYHAEPEAQPNGPIPSEKDVTQPDPEKSIQEAPEASPKAISQAMIPPLPSVVIPQYEPKASSLPRPQRDRRLPARYREDYTQHTFLGQFTQEHEDESRHQFAAAVLARFEGSQRKEVNGLLERGVFEYVQEKDIPPGTRIFTARFVNDIKNPGTDKAFEKSRLVVQAYNDGDKEYVLTQSPTIQRASQRIILCLGMIVENVRYYIRDITQAYIQSTTKLNRDFYIRITPDLAEYFPGATFLKVVRPLYGIPEAGNHWFRTYHNHHTEKLNMETSTYDPCLLHCSDSKQGFGIYERRKRFNVLIFFANPEKS